MRRPRAVLLDAVGTLIEPREAIGGTYARVARAHGASIGAWRLEDAFRRVFPKAPPMLFPDAPAAERPRLEREAWRAIVRSTFLAADSAARFDDFDALFAELFDTMGRSTAWRVRDGAHEALVALRERRCRIAVVSNFDSRLPDLLDGLGIGRMLDAVAIPPVAGAAKPDPAIFRFALDRLRVDAADAVVVGDHPDLDLAPAAALGMAAVDVRALATLADLPERIDALFESARAT